MKKNIKNKGLKVGDRIKEGARFGKVVAFHTAGTIDIVFDDEEYPMRRQLPNVFKANPDIEKAQFHAQVQGIYESQVRDFLDLPYNTPFEKHGHRLDQDLTKKARREILSGAFAIATAVGRKDGYLHRPKHRHQPYPIKPTKKGVERIIERASHPEEFQADQDLYEETLELSRKNPMKTRRNVATPIGVGRDEMRKIISTPFGKHPMDKYIREEYLPRPKKNQISGGGKAIPKVAEAMLYLRASILPRSLLGSSSKTEKTDGSTAEVRVMYLQPHKKSDEPMPKGRPFKSYPSDFNDLAQCDELFPITVKLPSRKRNPDTCPFAGECSKVCLIASGQLGKEDAHFAGYMKTWLWFLHPVVFLRQLILECKKEGNRSAKYGYDFYARLNGTSDIVWEKYIKMDKMVKDFVGLKGFYDYTKWTYKARTKQAKLGGELPQHYDLTFSMSEMEELTGGKYSSEAEAAEWLSHGGRVAVVVEEYQRFPDTGKKGTILKKKLVKSGARKGKYNKEYWAITDYSNLAKHASNAPDPKDRMHPLIVDGDQTDFRFNDPPYSIVILKPKGIYVDQKGRVFVTDSAYTDGRNYLTPKSRNFIKSGDYVLGLQDRILESLGEGSDQTRVAKNPFDHISVRYDNTRRFYFMEHKGGYVDIDGIGKWKTKSALKHDLEEVGYRVDGNKVLPL